MVKKSARANLIQAARVLYGLDQTIELGISDDLASKYRAMGMPEADIAALKQERGGGFEVLAENWPVLELLQACGACWRRSGMSGQLEGFSYVDANTLADWLHIPSDTRKRLIIAVNAVLLPKADVV